MNTALALARPIGPPLVFLCSTTGRPPWTYLLLQFVMTVMLVGLVLKALLWPDPAPSPGFVASALGWGVVFWTFYIPPGLRRHGAIQVFPDRIDVGDWRCSVTIPRHAITGVERWNEPLFDRPRGIAPSALMEPLWGFGRDKAKTRFRFYLTGEANAVMIRWAGGTPLVVTPDDPDGFVEAVRPG